MISDSPYAGLPKEGWLEKTRELIEAHPLDEQEIVDVVLQSWNGIFRSKIGSKGFRIGKHVFPKPQIMGFLLHELIPLEFEARYPRVWRGDRTGEDKDLVYIADPTFSVEIKTSSHRSQIFGNRSYAQKGKARKKSKSGYVLAVNFEKFSRAVVAPKVTRVRFGWLDHTDWVGQRAATGQQARLEPAVEQAKFRTLYASQ